MWGFSTSAGESLTLGENTWRFYNSSGELEAEVTADSGGAGGASDIFAAIYRLMGA
jgi:hypothetical protein